MQCIAVYFQRILPGKGSEILDSRMSADPHGPDEALSIWNNPASQDKHSAPRMTSYPWHRAATDWVCMIVDASTLWSIAGEKPCCSTHEKGHSKQNLAGEADI